MTSKADTVNISYSAPERKELNAIRAKYLPETGEKTTNLEKIRKLDARVESRATVSGLSTGIVSTLVTGSGMILILSLGQLVTGLLLCAAGLGGMLAAWPLYRKVLQREREKAAPEILRLSEED